MRAWVLNYYVATKWGSMQERTRIFGISLSEYEVRQKAARILERERKRGISVYPHYDLRQEMLAK